MLTGTKKENQDFAKPRRSKYWSQLLWASGTRQRNRNLPASVDTGENSGQNAFVNQLRTQKNLPPLERSKLLDDIALTHAHEMSREGRLFHSVKKKFELQLKLGSVQVAEDIQCGASLQAIQESVMFSSAGYGRQCSERAEFTEIGIGSCEGEDGMVYLCQLFRGGSK